MKIWSSPSRSAARTRVASPSINNIPGAFFTNFRIEAIRRFAPGVPIVNYDLHYLPTQGEMSRWLREGNPQKGIPFGGNAGLDRYDWYLMVSVTSETPLPQGRHPYSLIGVNLDDGSLYPEPGKKFVALLDFPRGNQRERNIQIEALKATGTEFLALEGPAASSGGRAPYSISEIRRIYRRTAAYFLAARESFGLPIASCRPAEPSSSPRTPTGVPRTGSSRTSANPDQANSPLTSSCTTTTASGLLRNSPGSRRSTIMYAGKAYEPTTVRLFEKSLKPGARVLDIGAHIGFYSLLAARAVGPMGHVYSFEPAPANFETLQLNIRANGYTNITPVQNAVGAEDETRAFYLSNQSGCQGLTPHPRATTTAVCDVDCTTIDTFLRGQHVDLIKMDIKGAEPAAIAGMRATIAGSPNLMLFSEFNPPCLRQAGYDPGEYLDLLKQLGFRVAVVDKVSHEVNPVTAPLSFPDDDPTWYVNLICTKGPALDRPW